MGHLYVRSYRPALDAQVLHRFVPDDPGIRGDLLNRAATVIDPRAMSTKRGTFIGWFYQRRRERALNMVFDIRDILENRT